LLLFRVPQDASRTLSAHCCYEYSRGVGVTGVDDQGLDKRWRQRAEEIGKVNFENEEMLRLGFILPEDLERLEITEIRLAAYRDSLKELSEAKRALNRTNAELRNLQDVEHLLRRIRRRRIERVKDERARRQEIKNNDADVRRAEIRRRRTEEPTFLGPRVSRRLRFSGGNSARLKSLGLPELESFLDIAQALDLGPSQLQWLVYERAADTTDHYTRFEIPKRRGGHRLISSPKPKLREAQNWIRENLLMKQSPSSAAMAFRPGLSIVDNARRHTGKGLIVRLDIRDFFPSITFPQVQNYFESLGYNPGVSTVLALICTDAPRAIVRLDGKTSSVIVGERSLPQGASTSPDLANLIALRLDTRLEGLARHGDWTYTRYADDLIFSHGDQDANAAGLVRAVTRIARDESFIVNSKKTRIMRQPNRQMVTGLMVSQDVRLPRETRRKIRAFLHRCEVRGLDVVSEEIDKSARAVAGGYVAYLSMIDQAAASALRRRHEWI
jgi:RNA-directed DNA polymerase